MAEPGLDFLVLHEIIKKAKHNLDRNAWDYIVGGSESETTLRRNRLAIDQVAFRPRVLRDVSKVDPSWPLLGHKLRIPVLLAPIGAVETFDPGGGAAAARAAAKFGICNMLSSVCAPGLEDTAASATDGKMIFQLYVRGGDDFVDDHAERAIKAGYKAFCITVDTQLYSRRERDLAKRYLPARRRVAQGMDFQAAFDWEKVRRFKQRHRIPLILKGIATAEDARTALELGVEGIYVSNHGGRQLDHGRGALDVLPEVVEVAKGRAAIIVDGGFLRGTDVVKAIALGADCVGVGRLYAFALAAGGEPALVHTLEMLEAEVKLCLGLLGVRSFAELDRSYLHLGAPMVAMPHVASCFPLLPWEDESY